MIQEWRDGPAGHTYNRSVQYSTSGHIYHVTCDYKLEAENTKWRENPSIKARIRFVTYMAANI